MRVTHPLMPVIICVKYGNNPSRALCAVERTRQDVPYFSSLIAKSWLNDPEDIGQYQRSLHATHPLILHYGDVIMDAIASQITSLTIVYSIVYSDADQRKTSKLRVTGLCAGNSPGTGTNGQ